MSKLTVYDGRTSYSDKPPPDWSQGAPTFLPGTQPVRINLVKWWKTGTTIENATFEAIHWPAVYEACWYADKLGAPFVIDIEHWPPFKPWATDAELDAGLEKYRQIVHWIKRHFPNLGVGIYGLFPTGAYGAETRDYGRSRAMQSDPFWGPRFPYYEGFHKIWIDANDRIARTPSRGAGLLSLVDFVAPSIYFHAFPGDNQYIDGDNEFYWEVMLNTAKGFGKPVMPVAWLHLHSDPTRIVPIDLFENKLIPILKRDVRMVLLWGGHDFTSFEMVKPHLTALTGVQQ